MRFRSCESPAYSLVGFDYVPCAATELYFSAPNTEPEKAPQLEYCPFDKSFVVSALFEGGEAKNIHYVIPEATILCSRVLKVQTFETKTRKVVDIHMCFGEGLAGMYRHPL